MRKIARDNSNEMSCRWFHPAQHCIHTKDISKESKQPSTEAILEAILVRKKEIQWLHRWKLSGSCTGSFNKLESRFRIRRISVQDLETNLHRHVRGSDVHCCFYSTIVGTLYPPADHLMNRRDFITSSRIESSVTLSTAQWLWSRGILPKDNCLLRTISQRGDLALVKFMTSTCNVNWNSETAILAPKCRLYWNGCSQMGANYLTTIAYTLLPE